MLREVLHFLDLSPGLTVVDGTIGAGGHSQLILKQIDPGGTLIGVDRDPMMLGHAKVRLDESRAKLGDSHLHLIQGSYQDIQELLVQLGHEDTFQVDRVLVDLGLSSDQLADRQRGFGFQTGGILDMRFDPTRGKPAWKTLLNLEQEQIAEVLEQFGEERFANAIAAAICQRPKHEPIKTAEQLVQVIEQAVPPNALRNARKHPATRVFQALRIAVNHELEHLETFLTETLNRVLKPGGRVVVLTFHSLEDRLVKQAFRTQSQWQNLTTKPVTATPAEQRLNPRVRTAKLRAAVKNS